VDFPWPDRPNEADGLIRELRTGLIAAAVGSQFIKVAQIS
jgi:hypothetical protein